MLTALLLLLAEATTEGPVPECPMIELYSAAPREGALTFLATPVIEGATYNWTISIGTIVDGQGTNEIVVEAEEGSFVTASVELTGLPEGCPIAYHISDEVLSWD